MFDSTVLEAAQVVADKVSSDLFSSATDPNGVVTLAVAGAGKTELSVKTAAKAREKQHSVMICSPTNEQVFALVLRLSAAMPTENITYVPASSIVVPHEIFARPNVIVAAAAQVHEAAVIIGTFDKLGDAASRGYLHEVDLLIADESFQADSGRYYAVAALARTHLLVGDPGQLSPFATVDATMWRGLSEDPLQTAVGVLTRHYPTTPVHRLPITRRLDSRAVPVVTSFYPGHPFGAAVLPGVRQLRLINGVSGITRMQALDRALDMAARDGWAHIELPDSQVLTADPETIDLIVALVDRLNQRSPEVRCERDQSWTSLGPERIAVGVSHNDQKDHLRVRLDNAGYPNIVVETANKLQGVEFDLVIAWHPLAGLPDPDGFHLDPGRLCVLLTRHRHACIVVGRAGDRALLDGIPPSTPAYLGYDQDPVLDGWEVHQSVYRELAPFRLAV